MARKRKEPLLDLHNEIKIITSSDETFDLWKELIIKYSQGELLDVDATPICKMRLNSRWTPHRDGILSREFFKWLGNCDEEDHRKLILHILRRSGESRVLGYPKVTVKQISRVLEDCYSAKEWLERRKRKIIVRRELNKLKPSLGFYNAAGAFQPQRWKKFKNDYNVTRASMQVLLDAPGDEFFAAAKQVASKNKSIDELSPYAKEFFKAFLRNRWNFHTPASRAYFRAYDPSANRLGSWPSGSWETMSEHLKLAVMDFRRLPGFTGKGEDLLEKPYFDMFMNMFVTADFPTVTEPPVWLWICGDKETELKATQLVGKAMFTTNYVKKYATYEPAKFERLEDLPATNKSARTPVCLLFLIKKSEKAKFNIPATFQASDTPVYTKPRKYQELQYRIQSTKLRMEFYLHLFELFCRPVDTVYSVFNGTKILCVGLVSTNFTFIPSVAILVCPSCHRRLDVQLDSS